jgi:hypothetical protein
VPAFSILLLPVTPEALATTKQPSPGEPLIIIADFPAGVGTSLGLFQQHCAAACGRVTGLLE